MRKMTYSKPKISSSSRRYSKEVIDSTIRTLNADINRLGQSVLPKHPYLVSVPSDVPYRHSSRFVNTWYVGTPFEKREEQLQYLSFLPHQDDHEELLRVVGGWSDDQGNYLEEELSPRSVFNSGRNTPLDQGLRKKISLKDYKTKDKMQTQTDQDHHAPQDNIHMKENVQPQAQPDSEGSDTDLKEQSRQSEDVIRLDQDTSKQPSPQSNPIPDLDGATFDSRPPTHEQHEMSARPLKRRKLSESPEGGPVKTPEKEPVAKQMPQLLSPTLPSPKPNNSLPELLSPILPPTLLKAIATPPPALHPDNGQQHHRSDSVRSILANAISEGSPRPSEKNGPAIGSLGSRIRSDSQHSARSTTSAGLPTNKAVAALKPSTPGLSPSRSPRPRQRHIIALKYGKKNRKRVEALLKFAARPKKVVPPQQDSRNTKPPPSSLKISRDHNSEAAVKLKAAYENANHAKRPTTPIPSVKEPKDSSTPTPDANKWAHATPKKEFKSTAMRRVESVEGGDPSTPGDKGRSSTPLGVEISSVIPKSSPGPPSVSAPSNEDRPAWLELQEKYHKLGRTLKHDATDSTEPGSPKYAVLIVEALLSFMINNTAQALVKPGADPNWSSIIPYHIFVFRETRKYPHLHGLVVQLGAVCRQQVHKYDLDRLGRDPLPDEYMGSAPTPGSDGNTKTTEDGERYRRRYLKFRDDLVRNARELQTAWLDGSRALSIELLQKEYTKTWAKRSREYRRRGFEKPTPGNISTEFFLPLDPASTPFEAIRFGQSLLEEWADMEGVKEWKSRIDL